MLQQAYNQVVLHPWESLFYLAAGVFFVRLAWRIAS